MTDALRILAALHFHGEDAERVAMLKRILVAVHNAVGEHGANSGEGAEQASEAGD